MPHSDPRLEQASAWLAQQLPALYHDRDWGEPRDGALSPASSDASFRRYFRWEDRGRSLILMDAPPPREDCRPFVRIAGLLAQAGLNVPTVLAQDIERGFLLLDDLGRQTYLDVIDEHNADELFEPAIEALIKLQQLPVEPGLPRYDEALLRRELQLFPEWYVERHLGLRLDEHQARSWAAACDVLVEAALAQPVVLVHRDYMPRNLMLSTPNPGVLDFQDAVVGPVTYDVTSLFKDAFLSWPDARVLGWLRHYWEQACAVGIPVQDSFEAFHAASDLMGAQRHLKVIGIFARICHRDGKPRYLADVPRFFAYLETVLARRPELSPLAELLASLPREARS